jgi:hypothetical protein
MPRDPESGERRDAMVGACLTVSRVQSIPWAAAPSSESLLLVTSVFVNSPDSSKALQVMVLNPCPHTSLDVP